MNVTEMKALITSITALFLVAILSIPAIAEDHEGEMRVERVIEVGYGGLVYVIDEVVGHGGKAFRYGIPDEMYEKLLSMSVVGGDARFVGRSYLGVNLYEINPSGDEVEIVTIYKELVSHRSGEEFIVRISPLPFIHQKTIKVSVTFLANDFVSYTSSQEGWEATPKGLERSDLIVKGDKPSSTLQFRFTSSNFAILNIDLIEFLYKPESKELDVKMSVRNLGGNTVDRLLLIMPRGLKVVSVEDHVGELSYSFSTASGRLDINLQESRYPLKESWRYTFFIRTEVLEGAEVAETEDGAARLVPFLPINSTISDFRLVFVLPPGYEFEDSSTLRELYNDAAGNVIAVIDTYGIDPYEGGEFTLSFTPSDTLPIAPWLVVGGLVVIVAGAISYTARLQRAAKQSIREVRGELVQTALRESAHLRELVEDLNSLISPKRGKVGPQIVRDKTSSIRRVRAKILEELRKIEHRPPQVERMMRDIDEVSGELYEACVAIATNYTDMLEGRLSRASYERVYNAFQKELRRSKARLAEVSESLRELLK